MKFTCPVCETTGDLPDDDLVDPVTRKTCGDCGAILLINPETGEVDAHKSPLKDSSVMEDSGRRATDKSASVLTSRPKSGEGGDRTAVVVIAIILIILIAAGVYFTITLDIF